MLTEISVDPSTYLWRRTEGLSLPQLVDRRSVCRLWAHAFKDSVRAYVCRSGSSKRNCIRRWQSSCKAEDCGVLHPEGLDLNSAWLGRQCQAFGKRSTRRENYADSKATETPHDSGEAASAYLRRLRQASRLELILCGTSLVPRTRYGAPSLVAPASPAHWLSRPNKRRSRCSGSTSGKEYLTQSVLLHSGLQSAFAHNLPRRLHLIIIRIVLRMNAKENSGIDGDQMSLRSRAERKWLERSLSERARGAREKQK